MPVSPEYWNDLREKLEGARPVTSKKMFGGVGLYLDGPIFGIVDNDRLFFKVDAETVAPYDQADAEMWMYDPAVGPIEKYRELPNSVLTDSETLGEWIDAANEAAKRMGKGKGRKKK